MSKFLDRLYLEPLDRGRRWRLERRFRYYSAHLGKLVTVPAGFECDLNSMPRLAWIVAPKTDYPEAGVVHDFLYRYGDSMNLTRGDADAVYREALKLLGMTDFRAGLRWSALRMFGWAAYRD
jgi:hypothetical protein